MGIPPRKRKAPRRRRAEDGPATLAQDKCSNVGLRDYLIVHYSSLSVFQSGSDFEQKTSQIVAAAQITFFIAGLEHPAVLDDNGEVPVELHIPQQPFGRGRKQLSGLDLAAQFDQSAFIGVAVRVLQSGSSSCDGSIPP